MRRPRKFYNDVALLRAGPSLIVLHYLCLCTLFHTTCNLHCLHLVLAFLLYSRVVIGPTGSGPNPVRTRNYKPEPGLNPKINLKPKSCPKNPKVKLGLENLAILPSSFDYFFVHRRQKVRLRPDIFVNFRPKPGPNPIELDPKSPARLATLLYSHEFRCFTRLFIRFTAGLNDLCSSRYSKVLNNHCNFFRMLFQEMLVITLVEPITLLQSRRYGLL